MNFWRKWDFPTRFYWLEKVWITNIGAVAHNGAQRPWPALLWGENISDFLVLQYIRMKWVFLLWIDKFISLGGISWAFSQYFLLNHSQERGTHTHANNENFEWLLDQNFLQVYVLILLSEHNIYTHLKTAMGLNEFACLVIFLTSHSHTTFAIIVKNGYEKNLLALEK